MRLLFYWRTKQKIRETRLERCAARESQYAALHLLRIFCPKSGACRNVGAMPPKSLVRTLKEKAALAGTSVAMSRGLLVGTLKIKSGACRNIGGDATQIAFGKYERKSGVCRNVWEDAKV